VVGVGDYVVPDQAQNLLWERSYTPEGGDNVDFQRPRHQADRGAAERRSGRAAAARRLYAGGARPGGAGAAGRFAAQVQRAVIIITNYNLTFKRGLAGRQPGLAHRFQTGQPAAGAVVTFTKEGSPLGEGVTDADGKALADLGLTQN
jgi:hypothetical protein